jgi:hypothetical protein
MATQHRLTDAQWRKLIAEQQTSGLSVEAFCRGQGLASSTFFARRQRLREASRPIFVEVTAEAATDTAAVGGDFGGDADSLIELLLPRGVVARVRRDFDAALLRRIVEALS